MALYLNTNMASLIAQNNVANSQMQQQNAIQQLSSGLRINSAKDDAAGLAVAQRMSAQISSLNQAAQNGNDGISMLQTADGAMSNIQNMLQRMKSLATEAANGTISGTQRGYIATEVGQIQNEIDAIGNTTTFNGQNLLTGALATQFSSTSTLGAGTAAGAAGITSVDVSNAKAGTTFTVAAYTAGDNAVTLSDGTTSQTVALGPIAANGSSTLDFNQLGVKISLSSLAGETADNIGAALGGGTVVTSAGSGSVTLQVGAGTTANDQVTMAFADTRIASSASLATLKTALTNFNVASPTQASATALMSAVDTALDFFSSQRATIGAVENRLTTAVANDQTGSQNLTSAQSGIMDTNYASETAALTKANILQQAGTAMLAQANSLPNAVLTLLRG